VSIRRRLVAAVTAIIATGLLLFAAVSIIAIDRTLSSTLDARLLTSAEAIAAAIDVHRYRPDPDNADRQQLATLHSGIHAAILNTQGHLVDGEPPPHNFPHLQTASIVRYGIHVGTVDAWSSGDWIANVDRVAMLIALIVGIAFVGLGIIVARLTADAVVAPLDRIVSLAERIEARDLSLRLRSNEFAADSNAPDTKDELGRLCASFDRMLDRLQSAFTHERRFTADASHELRAPLAVLRAETEVALRRERTNAEYQRALTAIAREAERLETLVDDLLAAARAETDAAERQTVDVGAVVRDVAERVAPPASLKRINVIAGTNAIEEAQHEFALVNGAMLERALLSIVHNAIAFTPVDGAVQLNIAAEEHAVTISVADNGPGFSPTALEHATERFWRSDGSRPRGGTGLGLAIARAVVEANGGTLNLSNAPHGGALVTVRLLRAG